MLVNYLLFKSKHNRTEYSIFVLNVQKWRKFEPRILHCALKQPRVGGNYVYAAVA